jgi:uncharacterized protein YecT (DUF1311 family)
MIRPTFRQITIAFSLAIAACTAIVPTPAQAQPDPDCANPMTQTDMNLCAARDLQQEDDRLNEFYGRLIPNISIAEENLLIDAQLAWINYRDAECEFSASAYLGGSIAPLIDANCRQALTSTRADELLAYLEDRSLEIYSYDLDTVERQEMRFFDANEANLSDNAMRLERLQSAETAWENYLDAACAFESLPGNPIGLENCQIRLTAQRLDRLTNHLLLPY